jgi:hypothetical protein
MANGGYTRDTAESSVRRGRPEHLRAARNVTQVSRASSIVGESDLGTLSADARTTQAGPAQESAR